MTKSRARSIQKETIDSPFLLLLPGRKGLVLVTENDLSSFPSFKLSTRRITYNGYKVAIL